MIARVGIDASYNSTGLCIHCSKGTRIVQICSGNMQHSKSVIFVRYERSWKTDEDSWAEEEMKKIISSENLFKSIYQQLMYSKEIWGITGFDMRIEGNLINPFMKGKLHSIYDMTTLTAVLKTHLRRIPNSTLRIVPISTLKKKFTGYGSGKKANMQEKFLTIFPAFDTNGKIDDVIDAYALAVIEI